MGAGFHLQSLEVRKPYSDTTKNKPDAEGDHHISSARFGSL